MMPNLLKYMGFAAAALILTLCISWSAILLAHGFSVKKAILLGTLGGVLAGVALNYVLFILSKGDVMKTLKLFAPVIVVIGLVSLVFYAAYQATVVDVYAISHSTQQCAYVETMEGRVDCPDKMPERYSMFWVE